MFTKICEEVQTPPRRACLTATRTPVLSRQAVAPRHASAVSVLPVPAQRAAIAVPSEERHAPTARHFVSRLLVLWGIADDDRDSAVLVVGELVANTAQHGRSNTTVVVSLAGRTLHIEVADHGKVPRCAGRRTTETDSDEHGRGLFIVEALAERVEITEEAACRRTRVNLSVTHSPTSPRMRRAA